MAVGSGSAEIVAKIEEHIEMLEQMLSFRARAKSLVNKKLHRFYERWSFQIQSTYFLLYSP